MKELTVDGIPFPYRIYVYNQGRIRTGIWTGTYFWALLTLSGPEGVYPISAVATNETGITSMATVTFIKDTTPPQVVITEPAGDIITGKRTLVVSGNVNDPTATVRNGLTGEEIPVVNGEFSTMYELESFDGPQDIYIIATDPASNSAYDSRYVILYTHGAADHDRSARGRCTSQYSDRERQGSRA